MIESPDSSYAYSLREIPALLLVGGLGTRLRSVFSSGPKCMAPIGGRPFLEYLLSALEAAGIQNVVLCAGYKSPQLVEWSRDIQHRGMEIHLSIEDRELGTAGALKLAQAFITTESFFAMNGDSFLDVSLGELYRFHTTHSAAGTIALARQTNPSRYGTVEMNSENAITRFVEKSRRVAGVNGSAWVNGGAYLFRRQLLDLIPENRAVSLEKDIFPSLAGRLRGFHCPGYFIDIGIPADLKRARSELPRTFPL